MSEAKESADKKLGIDVVINFEGITKIVKTLQEKINVALKGEEYTSQTQAEFDVADIRNKITSVEDKLIEFLKTPIKIKGIPSGTDVGVSANVEGSLPSSMNIMGATTPQKLLNQFTFENLMKIMQRKDIESRDPFANMELTDRTISKFVDAWKSKTQIKAKDKALIDAIKSVKEEKMGIEEKQILYEEILRAILKIEGSQERLTNTAVARFLQQRQLGREERRRNPLAYSELGSTPRLKKLHKNIITIAEKAMEKVGAITTGDITTKEAVKIIDTAQRAIAKKASDAIEEKSIRNDVTTKTEAAYLGKDTNKSLEELKTALEMTAKKGQKDTHDAVVERLKENKVLSISTSEEIKNLKKDIKGIETFADFMALKMGKETIEIVTKKLNEIVSDKATQDILRKKVVRAFETAAKLGSGSAMKSVATYIRKGLEDETKIKQVAKRFNDVYKPIFESLAGSIENLSKDELFVIKKFSEVSEALESVGSKSTAALGIITLLSNLKIDEESATIVETTLRAFKTYEKSFGTYARSIKNHFGSIAQRAGVAINKVNSMNAEMDIKYFDTSDYAKRLTTIMGNLETAVPSLEKTANESVGFVDDIHEKTKELAEASTKVGSATEIITSLTEKLIVVMDEMRVVRSEIIEGVVEGINIHMVNVLLERLESRWD